MSFEQEKMIVGSLPSLYPLQKFEEEAINTLVSLPIDDDAISRAKAIEALDEQIEQCNKSLSSFDISIKDEFAVKVERASLVTFRETLEYLPTAEPQRIKGKWALQSDDYHEYYECDQCGMAVGLDDVRNFCPNCGADMRGEQK